jgi:TP901 family phage tail tape measure protein
MAERIISLKLSLKGQQTTLKQLDSITLPLAEAGKLLADIKTKSVSIDTATQKVKQLTQQFQLLNKEIEKASKFGFGGGATAPNAPSAPSGGKAPKAPTGNAALKAELLTLDSQAERYKEIIALLAQYKQKQEEVNAEIRRQAREFEQSKVAVGSYKDLNAQLGKARDAFRSLSVEERNGSQGKALLANIGQLDNKLKDIDKSIGIYTRNVGNYQSALSGIGSVVGQFFSASALLAAGQQILQQNALISDSIADVAKTANASIADIQKLAEELKLRDTRTSLQDLLKIAEIGGQLGENADSLASFTAAIDVLGVALGDEFGDDVARVTKEVAGLRNSLGNFKTSDTAGDILRLGNALNVLSASGNSTAGVTTDIASRLAGLGTAFNLSAGEILGLASRLDELNIPAERAGGAIQRVLNEIAKSPEKFAALTGKSIPEFKTIVNQDLVGAFELVLESLDKSGAQTTQFADILDQLGLEGVGAIEVFSKLGQDTDALRASIDLASKSLGNTNAVYDEFTKKNSTLGAELQKLKNDFLNTFTDSQVSDALATIVKGIRYVFNAIGDLVTGVFQLKTAFSFLKGINYTLSKTGEGVNELGNVTESVTGKIVKGFKASLDAVREYGRGKSKEEKQDTELTTEQIEERLRIQKEAREKAKAAAREARAEEKRQREQEQRDILEAAKNIGRLQLEALDKTFEGRRERAKKEGENAISQLVGTPEQVKEQTDLINAAVLRSLDEINNDLKVARQKIAEDIQETETEFAKGTADFITSGAQRQLDNTKAVFEQQLQFLRLSKAKEFAELEASFQRGEITAADFERRRQAQGIIFAQRRLDLQKTQNAELALGEADLLAKNLAQKEVAFKAEIDAIRKQEQEKKNALGLAAENGTITPNEAAVGIQAAEDAANLASLEATQNYLAEKDRLQAEYAATQIERLNDTAQQEIDVTAQKNEKLKELQAQYEDVLKAGANQLAQTIGEFLGSQEKDAEAFFKTILTLALDALEKLILIQIASATAQSFAQPDSVATFGATGAVRAGILSALITAGFEALKAAVQSFEKGGAIPGTEGGEGEAKGPSHANGGIKTMIGGRKVEIEGGEHILRNGRETYIINRRSSRIFRHELASLHGGQELFSPRKRALAEQINTFGGYGRAFAPAPKFESGGVLSISPLPAPVVSGSQNEAAQHFIAVTENIMAMVDATNARIDRLVVIADPLDLAIKGANKASLKIAKTL